MNRDSENLIAEQFVVGDDIPRGAGEPPRDKATRMLRDTKRYARSEATRTAALTWAQLEAAAATDRQTAVLEQMSRNLQTLTQLHLYNTPSPAISEAVRDQIKTNIGIQASSSHISDYE